MFRSVISSAALAGVLSAATPAQAQCASEPPPLNDKVCLDIGNSIDDYKTCYALLYDKTIIPAFTHIAECSHARADATITSTLESISATVLTPISDAIASIVASLSDTGGPGQCIDKLNAIADGMHGDDGLNAVIARERAAADQGPAALETYRRTNYIFPNFVAYTDAILAARKNRAACSAALLAIRKNLTLFADLKIHQPDYCKKLRDGARYEDASRLQSLAQWAKVDPNIHFDQYFNASVTWNSQCGYIDGGSGAVRFTPCLQGTLQYKQTLSELDGSLIGWLSDNRNVIVAVATATAATVAGYAGAGATAGPIGAAVGAVVGAIISGINYWMLSNALDELDDLIDDKQNELKAAVNASYITEPEFFGRIDALCAGWEPKVKAEVDQLLAAFDAQSQIARIDAYFALSDKLHNWYNELFLWATTGEPGQRFLDEAAKQKLVVQRAAFDQQLFAARTTQEMAAQENVLVNIKAVATQLSCSDPATARLVKTKLRVAVQGFNSACTALMSAVAQSTRDPIPFTDPAQTSDVTCGYAGFRGDVAKLEIRAGAGHSADMTLRSATGAAIAEFTGVTSDSMPDFPGFSCSSYVGFGTSAENALAPATYDLHAPDNFYGFGDAEGAALRSFVQTTDSGLRSKVVTCNRALGTPVQLTRTGDACGIPVAF